MSEAGVCTSPEWESLLPHWIVCSLGSIIAPSWCYYISMSNTAILWLLMIIEGCLPGVQTFLLLWLFPYPVLPTGTHGLGMRLDFRKKVIPSYSLPTHRGWVHWSGCHWCGSSRWYWVSWREYCWLVSWWHSCGYCWLETRLNWWSSLRSLLLHLSCHRGWWWFWWLHFLTSDRWCSFFITILTKAGVGSCAICIIVKIQYSDTLGEPTYTSLLLYIIYIYIYIYFFIYLVRRAVNHLQFLFCIHQFCVGHMHVL